MQWALIKMIECIVMWRLCKYSLSQTHWHTYIHKYALHSSTFFFCIGNGAGDRRRRRTSDWDGVGVGLFVQLITLICKQIAHNQTHRRSQAPDLACQTDSYIHASNYLLRTITVNDKRRLKTINFRLYLANKTEKRKHNKTVQRPERHVAINSGSIW